MIYFTSRKQAREFGKGRKVVDLGAEVEKRWAVKVV